MLDVHNAMPPEGQVYLRATREPRFGMTLEEFVSEKRRISGSCALNLHRWRNLLMTTPFLGGDTPKYAGYCVFGMFMLVRCASEVSLVESSDPIFQWNEAMLDFFGGLARTAPRAKSPTDAITPIKALDAKRPNSS
jgi:hypothetical protein